MPFLENHDIHVHYQVFDEQIGDQASGNASAVLLLHGFSGSIEQWQMAGFIKALQGDYQVVVIDLRGHGQSSKPHSPEQYSLEQRLNDIVVLLDHLQISRVHIAGYSMGGWLAFGMVKHYPHRVASLCIGGAHPFSDSMAPFRQVKPRESNTFIKAFELFIGEKLSDLAKAMIVQNDLEALTAAAQDRDDLADVIPSVKNIPVMLFCGEQDHRLPAMQTLAQQLGTPLLVLPGVGHALAPYSGPSLIKAVHTFLVNAAPGQTASS